MPSRKRKRPCRFCRKWFPVDPRIGDRQFACPKAACQAARQSVQQAAWRRRNPDYFLSLRIRAKTMEERPPVPFMRPPLDRLPWDDAQMQFKTEALEFIAGFGRVLVAHAQTLISRQHPDTS